MLLLLLPDARTRMGLGERVPGGEIHVDLQAVISSLLSGVRVQLHMMILERDPSMPAGLQQIHGACCMSSGLSQEAIVDEA